MKAILFLLGMVILANADNATNWLSIVSAILMMIPLGVKSVASLVEAMRGVK